MKTTNTGNTKLGKKIVVVSRPIGKSCPNTCPYLHNGCYAEATEHRFPNARTAVEQNMTITLSGVQDALTFAERNNKDIRIHERGDFCQNNRLDQPYVATWRKALKARTSRRFVWSYTHYYTRMLANLNTIANVSIYASIHSPADIAKARKAGFSLFAFCSKIRGKKGGNRQVPTYLNIPLLGRSLVCPEQRLGRKRVTCDKCRWCVEGKGNVVFLDH